jgi:hypothetical protein
MAIGRIIPFPSCVMPVLARCATKRDPRRTSSRESLQNLPPGLCPCISLRSRRFRRRAWANTQSSFISTMITSWGFILGSFCGIGVRAKSARRRGLTKLALITRKCDGPDFSGPDNSRVFTAPCDSFSINHNRSRPSYFVGKLSFASHKTGRVTFVTDFLAALKQNSANCGIPTRQSRVP